jgi:hypothetical protein
VLRACPDIADYARDGISDWNDFVETANLVRAALGVSPDAWIQACEVMGRIDAAVAVAAILQRSDHISSAGGYLRALTDKARVGNSPPGRSSWLCSGQGDAQLRRGRDRRLDCWGVRCKAGRALRDYLPDDLWRVWAGLSMAIDKRYLSIVKYLRK